MTLNFIEYLESKNFEVDEIILLQRSYLSHSSDDEKIIKKMDAIYKVFLYTGLSELHINKLICNNPGLLQRPDYELIKIAYVWEQTGFLFDACDGSKGLQANNYIRIYLRNLYFNSGIKSSNAPISYYSLVVYDEDFIRSHSGTLNGLPFSPSFEALIDIYGKGKSLDEKKQYIDSLIGASSLKWYLDCLKREKLNQNERKPI